MEDAEASSSPPAQTPPDSPVSVASPLSPLPDNLLRLRLKTLDERVFDVEASSSMSVSDFRAKVALVTAVPAPRQRLIYRGKLLKDGAALAAYDLQDGHTVHLVAKPPANTAASSTTQTTTMQEQPETARGPAWNLANLRSALNLTGPTVQRGQPLPMLRELLDEMNESPQEAAEAMGLGHLSRSQARQEAVDLEPITQGILTMRTVLSTAEVEADERVEEEQVTTPTRRGPRQFFVGQWLDVKDTVNQWLESTVMAIEDGKVLIHYHGWPARWDEWIDFESDRIAAFRTRTMHTQNTQRMSPVPTTRVPSAPRVGDNDVRRMVVDVRNLMREMMPHMDRLAELCEDDLRREQDQNEASSEVQVEDSSPSVEGGQAQGSQVSEVAHLVAPLFDRFGRLLMDSAGYFDPLLRPELRGTSQRQQERRTAILRRGGSTQRQEAEGISASMEAQDNSLSIRDLIASSPSAAAESNQPRRSIDVHIHAIVAPASLSSLASLNRGNNSDGAGSTRSVQTPTTPPIGRSFDENGIIDEGDHSRVPLLGAYRHRSHSQTSDTSQHRQQREVARDLDEYLSNDFFGTSFVRDDSDDESESDYNSSFTHSDAVQSDRSAYRPPSPSVGITSPRTPQSEGSPQFSSASIGVIPEVAAAEDRLRASSSENGRSSESSSGSAGFPTFLEVMRRTLSGVRSFVHHEASNSPTEETNNPVELVSGFSLPSSESSESSLSTPPVSPVIQSSIGDSMSRPRSPSDSSIDEDLDLDEVD
ncbi:Ubiquilin [Phytophthora citrophthora]|uniref:Ubiquilin n=1 Tax=Phytophthora citrophthora TaxID=4793 RepID=A0AAD9LB98_9STRA|nr:Ubiquilin [Phytophthora citrophthora]